MATVTVLRPSATSSSTGWSAVPSGTLHGVTSDNSDSTYALWSGAGAALVLQTPLASPPGGERRHQIRVRARGEDGDAWWAARLQSGVLTAGATASFPATPDTSIGSWGFGAPPDGPTILAAHIEGQTTNLKIEEIYVDVDSREAPAFTPQTLDGGGNVTTSITDTSTPTLHASAIDLDGLPARQYRYWVTSGSTVLFDTGIVSGPAADTLTSPLINGSYTFHAQLWTTLGDQYENPSAEMTLGFSVLIGDIPKPNDPDVTAVEGTPFYSIEVCAPDVTDLDSDQGYIEIQRVGCVESDDPDATTLAILGPLDTDECTTWTDFSLPRTGLAATAACDHPDEACCFYYRARTIGRQSGNIVISPWSDVTDSGLPRGLVFFWPSTAASIPAGWSRVAALDGRYPKGAAAAVQPGLTGGSATHTHTLPSHTHDLTHSHTVTGNTSAAVGSVGSTDGAAGTTAIAATHTHTRPAVNSTTVASGSTTPTAATASNDLARLEVIHIESDGTPAGVPNGALGLSPTTTITGWTDHAAATGRYLKGAATGADGGTQGSGNLGAHTHTVSAHTHAGTSHIHTSANTGTVTSNLSLFAGAVSALWTSTPHSHTITVGSTSTAALDSGGSAASGGPSMAPDPPFTNVRVKQNTSGGASIPVGIIGAWRGSLGTIPNHFQLCDGTNGTPDLRDRYPKAATSSIGTTGGSLATHTHSSASHTHTTSGHTHTETIGAATAAATNVQSAAVVTVATATHSHTGGNTDSTTPTVGGSTSGTLAAQNTEPPYETVAFVQLVEPFVPEPEPAVVCLEWDDDQHLIRTYSAGGALWAPIAGTFTWNVERPLTTAMGVNGTRFVTSAAPGGRNLSMTAAVESEAELIALHAVLSQALVLISPSDSTEVWAAPVAESVRVIKVGRIRQVSADFIATGPEPAPQIADVGV